MCENPLKEHLELYHEIRKTENACYVQKNTSVSASWFHNSDSHKTQMCFTLPYNKGNIITLLSESSFWFRYGKGSDDRRFSGWV